MDNIHRAHLEKTSSIDSSFSSNESTPPSPSVKTHQAFFRRAYTESSSRPSTPSSTSDSALGSDSPSSISYTNPKLTTIVTRISHEEPAPAASDKKPFDSREAMHEAEITRRNEESTLADRGHYKVKPEHLAGADLPHQDIVASIVTPDEHTKLFTSQIGFDPTGIRMRSSFFATSALNGKRYTGHDGNVHTVHHAASNSADSSSDTLAMARVLTDEQSGEAIFYAGRPDTHKKVEQQGTDIFRTEFTGSKKGLEQIGENTFVLTYMVDSLTNLTRLEKKGKGFNERESFLQEQKVLEEHRLLASDVKLDAYYSRIQDHADRLEGTFKNHFLKTLDPFNKGLENIPRQELMDRLKTFFPNAYKRLFPNAQEPKPSQSHPESVKPIQVTMEDGKTYTVYLNPIHVHHTMNATGEFSKLLLDTISGQDLEREQNEYMLGRHLAPMARGVIARNEGTPKGTLTKNVLTQLEENKDLKVHERLFLMDLLARLVNLPIVHHCKSVIDRTSVAGSVGAVNHYLLKNKSYDKFPNPPQDIIKTEGYRELFVGVLNMQHQVSQDSRMGVLPDGTQVGRETLGLQLNKGILGMTGAIPLLPDAAVKENSNPRFKILCGVVAAILLAPLYYLALAVASIYFKYKTGSFQPEMILSAAAIPFTLKYANIRHLNFKYTIDNTSEIINGEGRHINHHAPINKKEKGPQLRIPPSHFYSSSAA